MFQSLVTLIPAKLFIVTALIFDPPEAWVDLRVQNPDPDQFHSFKSFASPDGDAQVTVMQQAPIKTERDAAEFVRGMIVETGFSKESVEETRFGRYEARHLKGELAVANDNAILIDTYLVFSDSALTSITIAVDAASGTREVSNALLKRISIPGKPIMLMSSAYNLGHQIGYRVGQVFAWILLATFIVWSIRLMRRRRSRDAE